MNARFPQLPLTAIALIVGSAACFTIIDAIVKYLGSRYSVPLIVLARWGIPALLIGVLLGPKLRWKLLRTARPRLHVARAAVLILSSLSFFTALKFLPLAEATGLNYLTPALVTVMAVWFLRERNTRSRWMFVFAGCVGILLIVGPGNATLHVASLFALGAAALNATFQILTRKLAGEDFIVLVFYPSVVGSLLIALTIPFVQYDASYRLSDILLLVAIGGLGGLGHCLFVEAFRRAPAAAIAPFMYVQLLMSTLVGWLIFDTFPDHYALSGMAVIAASAVILTWSENRRGTSGPLGSPMLTRRWSPMVGVVPVAGPVSSYFGGVYSDRAAELSQLNIGESMAVLDFSGTPRTVFRTD